VRLFLKVFTSSIGQNKETSEDLVALLYIHHDSVSLLISEYMQVHIFFGLQQPAPLLPAGMYKSTILSHFGLCFARVVLLLLQDLLKSLPACM
jgi:hypothetical protein